MDISNLAVDFAVVWNGNFIIDNPEDLKGKAFLMYFGVFLLTGIAAWKEIRKGILMLLC